MAISLICPSCGALNQFTIDHFIGQFVACQKCGELLQFQKEIEKQAHKIADPGSEVKDKT